MNTNFKTQLEKQLREKINQKANNKVSDEAYVIKAMKFFDIYNTGTVTYQQFHQALEKIGVYYSLDELMPVLKEYDPEGKQKIDYVEFSKYLFNSKVPKAHQMKQTAQELHNEAVKLLDYFRRTLAHKTGNGFISLRRIFNIVDQDRSGQVTIAEFASIMKEFKIDLSMDQINLIFKIFDLNKDGTLSYEEFIAGVRGKMNESRLQIVSQVFDKLDQNKQGFVDIQDVVGKYTVTNHPAVVEGRKTEEQVLGEFLDTFEVHHNLTTGNQSDPRVSKQEFIEYYDNISSTIADDEYFISLVDSCWNVTGGTDKKDKFDRAWTDKNKWGELLNDAYSYKNLDPKDVKGPTIRSGLESGDNPWQTITPYYKVATANQRSLASQHDHLKPRDHTQITGEESIDPTMNHKVVDTYNKYLDTHRKPTEAPHQIGSLAQKKDFELAMDRFKANVIQKGTRGIIGLKRQFKILDDDNDGTLDLPDFQRGLEDYKVQVNTHDLENIYHAFNVQGTTRVNYIQLLKYIIGDLSPFRAAKVELAWRKINKQNADFLNWNFISKSFDASRHPGVKAGYITEDEIQHDFEETFKALHSVYHSFQPEQPVTKDEFFEYFRILSTTIPNDKVFDFIMTGCWNIDLRDLEPKTTGGARKNVDFDNTRSAWKYDFHRSIYGKMDDSPFQHPVVEKSSRPQRPKTAVTADMPVAGVYNWPYAKKSNIESNVQCLGSDKQLTRTDVLTNDYQPTNGNQMNGHSGKAPGAINHNEQASNALNYGMHAPQTMPQSMPQNYGMQGGYPQPNAMPTNFHPQINYGQPQNYQTPSGYQPQANYAPQSSHAPHQMPQGYPEYPNQTNYNQ